MGATLENVLASYAAHVLGTYGDGFVILTSYERNVSRVIFEMVRQQFVKLHMCNCNCNIFVNAPYFDTFMHRLRGADGLPWWSPSQVLIIN
jgi:hypothetical protein